MNRLRRGEKGFTLVELLVVMSILAVLSALVFSTVTGMKTGGETAAAKSDAKEVENATGAFNTNSRTQSFPELGIACTGQANDVYTMTITNTAFVLDKEKDVTVARTGDGNATAKIITAVASAIGLPTTDGCSGTLASHTLVDFDAETTARQADGSVIILKFIPDFLASTPKSATWVRGTSITDSGVPDEYIWLLKKGTASDAQGRTLQVLRLNQATLAQYEIARY